MWRWILGPGSSQTGALGLNLIFEKLGLGFPEMGVVHRPDGPLHPPGVRLRRFPGSRGPGRACQSVHRGLPRHDLRRHRRDVADVGIHHGHVPCGLARDTRRNEGSGAGGRGHRAPDLPAGDHADDPAGDAERAHRPGAYLAEDLRSRRLDDGAGPAFATDVPAFYMWDTTFRGNNFAQGAAIAILLLFVVALLIIPYLVSSTRSEART